MASSIGIKIANGEFYSIIEENSVVKKRLILTTVHDSQKSVQIDLYRSFAKTMADALYIGSLVVENIKPRSKGEPSIELVIASNQEGEITADAVDLDASADGDHHHLSVSLKSLDEDSREYELPDFELESHEPPPQGLYEKASKVKQDSSRKFPLWMVILIGLVIILICLALWFFLFREKEDFSAPEEAQPSPAVVTEAPPAPAPEPVPAAPEPAPPVPAETPVIQAPQTPPPVPAPAPARRNRPEPPVASYKVPDTIPREGAPYRIRWGDTLWDISEAFYRNPWLYPRIARFNNIRNPDRIISGT
ncbi:MAG: Hsp70 family protein, partial [Spirochaetaceae bacterium]|nr:Hsp70 family protein [Spirochaetaceae bacterium]